MCLNFHSKQVDQTAFSLFQFFCSSIYLTIQQTFIKGLGSTILILILTNTITEYRPKHKSTWGSFLPENNVLPSLAIPFWSRGIS